MKNNQDIFFVFILLIVDNFLLGAGFDIVTNGSIYLSFLILLLRFYRRSLPQKNVFFSFICFAILAVLSLVINGVSSFTTITLEATFLLRFVVLISILSSPLSFNARQMSILKYLMWVSLFSMFLQFVHTFITNGTGMLLRGDRNHSAVVITSFFIFYYALFGKKSLLSIFFVITNFSRNLVLGLFIFFAERFFLLNALTKSKYIFFIGVVFFLNSLFYLYGYVLDNYFSGVVGSTNDLSRLFVVFDGSNTLRFTLNYDFLKMVGENLTQFLIFTGKYSDLKEVLGLYPHNSYLHLLYRAGVIRAFLLLSILIYFVRSKGAILALTIFLFQAAFIHEMFLNSAVILLACSISIFNNQEQENERCIYNRRSRSSA